MRTEKTITAVFFFENLETNDAGYDSPFRILSLSLSDEANDYEGFLIFMIVYISESKYFSV